MKRESIGHARWPVLFPRIKLSTMQKSLPLHVCISEYELQNSTFLLSIKCDETSESDFEGSVIISRNLIPQRCDYLVNETKKDECLVSSSPASIRSLHLLIKCLIIIEQSARPSDHIFSLLLMKQLFCRSAVSNLI
jgi:hypothetical protein